jgi:hypothetical protein
MTTNYQNQVQSAIADNDCKRAAALLDDYNNQNKWRDQQAQILASYGNFECYRPLYGDTAVDSMQRVWDAKNPDVAYRTGQIDAETYKSITGSYPAGYTPPWSGGWGGWGYGGDLGGNPNNIVPGGDTKYRTRVVTWTNGKPNIEMARPVTGKAIDNPFG